MFDSWLVGVGIGYFRNLFHSKGDEKILRGKAHTCVCGSSIAAMNLECQILNEKKHEKNVRYVLPLSV